MPSSSFFLSGHPARQGGFTLVEMAIVFVVIGLVLSIGVISWQSFAEARRFAKARSQLMQMKDCLVRGVVFTEHYPRGEDFEKCSASVGLDPWGKPLTWIVGFTVENTPLNATHAVVSDKPRGQVATNVSASSRIILSAEAGGNQPAVAFALVNLGKDGLADNSTYSEFPVQLGSGSLVPNFSLAQDDQVLVVKGYELAATIKHAVGP